MMRDLTTLHTSLTTAAGATVKPSANNSNAGSGPTSSNRGAKARAAASAAAQAASIAQDSVKGELSSDEDTPMQSESVGQGATSSNYSSGYHNNNSNTIRQNQRPTTSIGYEHAPPNTEPFQSFRNNGNDFRNTAVSFRGGAGAGGVAFGDRGDGGGTSVSPSGSPHHSSFRPSDETNGGGGGMGSLGPGSGAGVGGVGNGRIVESPPITSITPSRPGLPASGSSGRPRTSSGAPSSSSNSAAATSSIVHSLSSPIPGNGVVGDSRQSQSQQHPYQQQQHYQHQQLHLPPGSATSNRQQYNPYPPHNQYSHQHQYQQHHRSFQQQSHHHQQQHVARQQQHSQSHHQQPPGYPRTHSNGLTLALATKSLLNLGSDGDDPAAAGPDDVEIKREFEFEYTPRSSRPGTSGGNGSAGGIGGGGSILPPIAEVLASQGPFPVSASRRRIGEFEYEPSREGASRPSTGVAAGSRDESFEKRAFTKESSAYQHEEHGWDIRPGKYQKVLTHLIDYSNDGFH